MIHIRNKETQKDLFLTLTAVLLLINRDRSKSWVDYDETDWQEGLEQFTEWEVIEDRPCGTDAANNEQPKKLYRVQYVRDEFLYADVWAIDEDQAYDIADELSYEDFTNTDEKQLTWISTEELQA